MSTVAVELARVEGRRLVRNPAVWLAFLLSAQWIQSATRTDNAEDVYHQLVGYALVVPGFVMLFHTVLAVLRARMAGTEELHTTVPVDQARRSIGHGASALAAGLIGLCWLVVLLIVHRPSAILGTTYTLRSEDPLVWQQLGVPRPNVAQMLQGPLSLVAASCLVVALARWIPTWLVMVPLAFAAMSQLTFAGMWAGAPTSAVDWLNPISRGFVHDTWVGCGETDALCDLVVSGFDRTTPWWHLAYLIALAVFFVAVAVLRHRRDRPAWLAFGLSGVALASLAAAQSVVYERFEPLVTAVGG
ncbi:MAG: hypothetical protein MUE78_04475 [Ilumatobacteraceae bacterium]|nr:hypothetical protein [Ilumatobacteraceae bacterium]